MKQLILFFGFIFSLAGYSQVNEKTENIREEQKVEKNRGAERKNRLLDDLKDLNLSEKQENQLKALFESERNSMKQNRERFKGDEESERPSSSELKEMREKMKERMRVLDGKVKSILSEEQYIQWKEKQQARMKDFTK